MRADDLIVVRLILINMHPVSLSASENAFSPHVAPAVFTDIGAKFRDVSHGYGAAFANPSRIPRRASQGRRAYPALSPGT